ncbi:CAP domain-containing protein [uncultured Lutibacter sp.]|uniref:CAP domain-containing protein n=1 Tax=Lutibacter sp. TaxID=1925666 RepID=UPI00261CD84F|nr:CAP domain-containing protein [uncultured Lutibacter sp.]
MKIIQIRMILLVFTAIILTSCSKEEEGLYFNERQEQLPSLANAKIVGENIAYGYNTIRGVLASWLNSDSHRALIENASFTHFGISTAKNASGKNYFTQIFIKR